LAQDEVLGLKPRSPRELRPGSDFYNQRLSDQRAEAVRKWLVSKEGLKGVKFATKGYGVKNPVAPNTRPDGSDNPDGRQKNRRVEITVKKG
jgi:outer membrane protein OmpA-like peptidoglycan-associated protein